jgi:hypothetical protein
VRGMCALIAPEARRANRPPGLENRPRIGHESASQAKRIGLSSRARGENRPHFAHDRAATTPTERARFPWGLRISPRATRSGRYAAAHVHAGAGPSSRRGAAVRAQQGDREVVAGGPGRFAVEQKRAPGATQPAGGPSRSAPSGASRATHRSTSSGGTAGVLGVARPGAARRQLSDRPASSPANEAG